MAPPAEAPPGCPPGLEYLTQIDQLLVRQQIELLESKHVCVLKELDDAINFMHCYTFEGNQMHKHA